MSDSIKARRRSCEILYDHCKKVGFEWMAGLLGVKPISLRKWTEPSKFDQEDLPFDPSGRINFLDRTAVTLRSMATDNPELAVETINWLARELGGVFITSDQLDSVMAILAQAQKQETKNRKAG